MAINESQGMVLSLLSAQLFGHDVDKVSETVDIDSVMGEAVAHSVLPIVVEAAKKVGLEGINESWQQKSYSTIANNIKNQKAHAELKTLLPCRYVILKGVASALYYSNPVLRSMGDVDFIVPEDELDNAGKELESNGITRVFDDEHCFHKNYRGHGFSWELHWAFPGVPNEGVPKEKAEYYLKSIFEDCVWKGEYSVPSDFHHGLILLLHTAEHITATGIGLRHLCDWAVFVNSLEGNQFVDMFKKPLSDIGLWTFAKVLTRVSEKYLGVSNKDWANVDVSEDVVDAIMQDILDSGNFGRKDKQRMNSYKFFYNADTGQVNSGSRIKNLFAFLSARARKAMPIVDRIKILMPIGWIYVSIRHLVRIARGTRYKINIKETLDVAQKRGTVYKELHLFEVES